MNEDREMKVYTSAPMVQTPMSVIQAMVHGARKSRYVSYRLFLKDLRNDYARSLAGLLWDFLDPLILGIVFYFLMQARIINTGDIGIPYALFVIYGVMLYQTFSDAVTSPLSLITRSKNMLTHLSLSPEALIGSVGCRVLFYSFFRIIIMLAFGLAMGKWSFFGILAFLLLFPIIILCGMSIGVLLAPFNTLYGDVGRIVVILLTPLRYMTPVLYAMPDKGFLSYVDTVNPLTPLLSGLRDLATSGTLHHPEKFLLVSAAFSILFLLGWFIFHISLPILAEKA